MHDRLPGGHPSSARVRSRRLLEQYACPVGKKRVNVPSALVIGPSVLTLSHRFFVTAAPSVPRLAPVPASPSPLQIPNADTPSWQSVRIGVLYGRLCCGATPMVSAAAGNR